MNLKNAWNGLKNIAGGPAIKSHPDDFPLAASSADFRWQSLINEFYAELPEPKVAIYVKFTQQPSVRRVLDSPAAEQLLALEAIVSRRLWLERASQAAGSSSPVVCEFRDILRKFAALLFRRDLPWTSPGIIVLIEAIVAVMKETGTTHFDRDVATLLKVCEGLKARGCLTPELCHTLEKLRAHFSVEAWDWAERRRMKDSIDGLILGVPVQTGAVRRRQERLDPRDDWAGAISEYLLARDDLKGCAWDELVSHVRTAGQSKPSGKWLKEAGRLLEAVGKEEFKARVAEWFPTVRASGQTGRIALFTHAPMNERNAEALKGLVWCCSRFDDEVVAGAVSDLAQACYRKVPGWGPLSAKVGNACLYTLGQLPGLAPIAQLSRLRLKVKYSAALRLIDKALTEAATRLGMTSGELEEIAVPTYGLDEHGCLREEFGDFHAELRIVGTHETELRWIQGGGKAQKSVPAWVKENCAEELKEFKRAIKDIESMLPAQRDRLERLLIAPREWEFEKWKERYLNHPLLAQLTRRLIWHFHENEQTAPGIWHDGNVVDVHDRPLDWFSSRTRVRLWHPLGFEPETVSAWRDWLEKHQITQPFKQAHREIYILTEAELRTGTYSNRFAAHIIKQHQFAALARQRGWLYRLQGAFDSHNTPVLRLPESDLAAEFRVEAAGGNERTSEMGIFLHLSTDQVRFCDATGRSWRLSEVPALTFSEVMRDVDLFVGVCSIGNDPAWQDSGETGRYEGYWQTFSFGELSATAKTRHEVLERLLPRLKVAAQCSLTDRFLVVRGRLRTYKIHLGSGNILMEPNDSYLCIVPGRSGVTESGSQKLFLPFEGDSTLAVILSKAFLLADDDKIKDPGIVSQIKR